MTLDTRSPAEIAYDAVRLSPAPQAAEPPATLVGAVLGYIVEAEQATFGASTYNYDKCLAVLGAIEAAVGMPDSDNDDFDARTLDQETADAIDVFMSWWRTARKARQAA